jgi:hypothetical protein
LPTSPDLGEMNSDGDYDENNVSEDNKLDGIFKLQNGN